jgi:MFS family permease
MLLLASAWLMTSMTRSPLLVASIQTVVSLPFFFLSIPFGFLGDRVGYRRILVAAHGWMLLSAGALALITWRDQLTPWLLLALLGAMGVGAAIEASAWKPLLLEMAPPDATLATISLNSMSNKIGQAAGPVLGSNLMQFAGPATVFATRALSNITMIIALLRVPERAVPESDTPASSLGSRRSLREGWTFLRSSRAMYGPLIRCAAFIVPNAGMIALLPLDARENIQTQLIGFGGLLTSLGMGSFAALSLLPWLRKRFPVGPPSTAALAVFSLAVLGVSQWNSMLADAVFLFVAGFAWSVLVISHQVAVLTAAPDGMRGLITSFYALTVQGSLAAGSFLFGAIAQHIGCSRSIMLAGLVAMSGLALVRRFPLSDGSAS